MAFKKKPKTSTMACMSNIAYPIHPFGPLVTPSEGENEIINKIVEKRTAEKNV
jgi:hypothetical protein